MATNPPESIVPSATVAALPLVTVQLLETLDKIASEAPHAANLRELVSEFAASFAAYLRTPD